ncbi:ATP-grasp fold amidoligase family protein [Fodinibius sediminis]|uniref:TupA-like ATPgrasp n=1 Tax=Fodinibius sediminis TaxID=1214077 RepID=A0A521D4Z5_9BACT|nr:ATP-grasp fold amidoligase family protein [Fodinibius sediminis]SMO66776.1 TupA-like ATPgrasp [Fodinibius sediminis]
MKKLLDPLLSKLFWGIFRHMLSDRWYAKVRYWLELNEWPDLEEPEKFTEKIQFIKLYERTPLRRQVADRTKVRNYVAEKVGTDHLIPLMDTFGTLTQKTWDSLPAAFVLKANHGCGMLRIVFDKEEEPYREAYLQTERWKKTDYFKIGREWVYRDLPRTLLAEKLLLNDAKDIPRDYKFFCFEGQVKLIQVDYDRFGNQKRNLFDRHFNRIEGQLLYPPYTGHVRQPNNLEKAISIAETLSADFNFIRVDLYLLDDGVYFGEMTNYPGNGFVPFHPADLERTLGSWISL